MILLHRADIQGCRHDDDDQIGTRTLLNLQRARQRDVAVKMALVKFVEDEGVDTLATSGSANIWRSSTPSVT